MATRIYKTPFAATGDKEGLATDDQPDGKVSLQAGWTPDYELPNDNANYRPVGRAEMNGVLNELTAALGEVQLMGFAKWQSIDGGWPLGAEVTHNGQTYRSTGDANTTEPGAVGALWFSTGTGLGFGQEWVNVTGSRAVGVTYTNSTNKPIMVSATVSGTTPNSTVSIALLVGSPAVGVGINALVTNANPTQWSIYCQGVVPPGQPYKLDAVQGSLLAWSELR